MAGVVWKTWLACLDVVFRRTSHSIHSLVLHCLQFTRDYCLSPNTIVVSPFVINVKWEFPPIGYTKINVDGSSLGCPSLAGIGGIVCDDHGRFICSFAESVGITFAYIAEALAVRQAPQLAFDRGFSHIILESDNLMIVNLLKRTTTVSPWRIAHIIDDCLTLSDLFPQTYFKHTFRQGNTVVDSLANFGTHSQASHFWDVNPPNFLSPFFIADLAGIFMPCSVSFGASLI
ncbi:uncharacterized protein LOC122061048 [Macadamia integrifolia]|uniref:uncharacterized protein LOC122061048 n=1 Tax=Macadamia integrifolia TaxID=60698 RepID=UPI001C5294CD|nr:uncharacterized protein LOC122061048 [Macadamia integrifolia]